MTEKFRTFMQQLHLAAKVGKAEAVAPGVFRLLQLGGFERKELGEVLSPVEQLRARKFWQRILNTRNLTEVKVKKSAQCFYAVIWGAAHRIPGTSVPALAEEYCGVVAEACELDLKDHQAEITTLEVKRLRFEPKVLQGGRI
jgi:hypothetical protein